MRAEKKGAIVAAASSTAYCCLPGTAFVAAAPAVTPSAVRTSRATAVDVYFIELLSWTPGASSHYYYGGPY